MDKYRDLLGYFGIPFPAVTKRIFVSTIEEGGDLLHFWSFGRF